MAWEPILWLIFLAINIALISVVIYQIMCLTDLEADYMNPYESSSCINSVVLKEYILHGAFCILFLVTGHWFIFLLTLLPAYYNVRKNFFQEEVWYEWVEQGRNMMSRSYFNQKSMVWLCHILQEFSKVKGKIVRRWNLQEQVSQIFVPETTSSMGDISVSSAFKILEPAASY